MIEVGIIVRRRQESPHQGGPVGTRRRGGKEGENPDHLRSEVLRTPPTPTRLDVSCMPLDYIPLSSCLPGDRYGASRVTFFYPSRHRFFFSSLTSSFFTTERTEDERWKRDEERRYITKHINPGRLHPLRCSESFSNKKFDKPLNSL